MSKKQSKLKTDPTIEDIIILGKFSDGKIRQIMVHQKNNSFILEAIRACSVNRIISVLDKEVPFEFEKATLPPAKDSGKVTIKKDKLEVHVWDWIVTKNGKVVQIIHDDMIGLYYEDIERLATPEEVRKERLRQIR